MVMRSTRWSAMKCDSCTIITVSMIFSILPFLRGVECWLQQLFPKPVLSHKHYLTATKAPEILVNWSTPSLSLLKMLTANRSTVAEL